MTVLEPGSDRRRGRSVHVGAVVALVALAAASSALADESGTSSWLPGTYGSLAVVPGTPGLNFAVIGYHTSVGAGAGAQFETGGAIQADLNADVTLEIASLKYIFAQPFLGGQADVAVTAFGGHNTTSAEVEVNGPNGGLFSAKHYSTIDGAGDLYPNASLRWNKGVNNFMVYNQEDVPIGAYDPTNIANLGLGHWSIDNGAGYTYFNPVKGHEFSAVAGFTYNFTNPDTQYKSGVDFHLDWGASQFLSPHLQVGLVGYAYQQVSGDSGSGARLGSFESRVFSVGPQIAYLFPFGPLQGYLNLKGYSEFEAQNRPEGWNVWLTLAFSPTPKAPPGKPTE